MLRIDHFFLPPSRGLPLCAAPDLAPRFVIYCPPDLMCCPYLMDALGNASPRPAQGRYCALPRLTLDLSPYIRLKCLELFMHYIGPFPGDCSS